MMNTLPHWCGWEQAAYVMRSTVGDFSELWSGVTRIFTVGLKWNLGQDQSRVGPGAILDRSAPCTAAFCVVAVTLSPLVPLHGCRDTNLGTALLSPCHQSVTAPALWDQVFSRTGNASLRVELSLPCRMCSVSPVTPRVVSHHQPRWFLLGRVRLVFLLHVQMLVVHVRFCIVVFVLGCSWERELLRSWDQLKFCAMWRLK